MRHRTPNISVCNEGCLLPYTPPFFYNESQLHPQHFGDRGDDVAFSEHVCKYSIASGGEILTPAADGWLPPERVYGQLQ